MASSMEIIHELIRTVLRFFYDEKCIVLVEFLLLEKILSDEELADRMRIVLKDVNRAAAKLREDTLLKSDSRQEVRPSDQKMVNKTYYYIDYKTFVDVVKYKMYMMKKSIEDQLQTEMENKGYKCPLCGKSYSPLELQSLLNPHTHAFECEVCSTEIEEHAEDPQKIEATQSTLSEFMEQTTPLVRILKRVDGVTVPRFDPAEYLKQKQAFAALSKSEQATAASEASGLTSPSSTTVNIQIQIESSDNPTVTHELPSWYSHSTVTGEQVVSEPKTRTESTVSFSSFTMDSSTTETTIKQYYENLQTSGPVLGKREHPKELSEVSAPSGVLVSVAGLQKPLEEVTEADKSNMTPDEYTSYFEAYMASLQ